MALTRKLDRLWTWRGIETWLPLLVVLLAMAGYVFLGDSARNAQRQRLQLETDVTAEQVRLRLEAWINARLAVVEHLGTQWPVEFVENPDQYRYEAQWFLNLYQGFQALNWIDADWVIRVTVPDASNEAALNKDLHEHPSQDVRNALARAVTLGRLSRTGVVDLLQGGKGFATYRPVFVDGRLHGFINGVFRVEYLVDACLAEPMLRERFRFELIESNGAIAYSTNPGNVSATSWPHRVETQIQLPEAPWTLRFAPTTQTLKGARVGMGQAFMVLGLILALGLAWALRALLIRQLQLRESEAKYKLLVENQTDMLVTLDPDLRIVFASPSYLALFNRSESNVLGRRVDRLILKDDLPNAYRAFEATLVPPHRGSFEQRALTPSGERWLEWQGTAILDPNGNVNGIVGVGRDITERKHLEEQLLQSRKLQAVGELAGGVAHDFNNLLQVVIGHLELALAQGTTDETTRDSLGKARNASHRAAELTKQLLAFSRKQVLHIESINLEQRIHETMELLQRLLPESIDLTHVTSARPPWAHADPAQVELMVMNLCLNARDAMPKGGSLRLLTQACAIREEDRQKPHQRPGSWAVLEVSDTGTGMSPEVLARIFEPFFTTKEVGRGTGLGLATVYGIVEQHGGWIDVESVPGEGSVFRVYLPAAEPRAVVAPATHQAPSHGGSETILVAEDEPLVRELTNDLLVSSGYRVILAENGLEACDQFERYKDQIDLVLLDAIMPKMSGREAFEHIRGARASVPILFTSGYGAEISGQGMEDVEVISKPYSVDDLLRRVRAALDG